MKTKKPAMAGKDRKRQLQKLMCVYKNTCQKCWRTVYANEPGKLQATIQHKMPRCLGGSNHSFNLTLWCMPCNDRDSKYIFRTYKKRKIEIMKQLFTISETVVILDSKIDGQNQLKVTDTKGFPVGTKTGMLTIPIASQDVFLFLGRQLQFNEFIIDPTLDYSKMVMQTGHFERTNLVIMFKYKTLEIWRYKGVMS